MPKTPTDFSKSVIYKIEHIDKPELVYVGSTTNFTKRKYKHKSVCNNENERNYNLKLYQMIRAHGDWDSFKIMIICEFPCNSKIELVIEEEKHRKELQTNLNSIKAYRTIDEKKQYDSQYDKQYRKDNKEKKRVYREDNKEKIKEKDKQYREANKEQINEKAKEKITCVCGSIFRISNKSHHEKSIKHCEFIKQIV